MGAIGHDGLAVPGKVELAHEPPFCLGILEVHPATRQLKSGDRSETIEPRVMQVLVALYRAGGIVTRDELILRCWEGRIVGDDAINRVIARIRQVALGLGNGCFALETITKVGYRLSVSGERKGTAPTTSPAHRFSDSVNRRTAIAGAVAVAAGAGLAGVALLRGNRAADVSDGPTGLSALRSRRRKSAQATELLDRTIAIFLSGRSEDYQQAVAYMTEATRLEPNDPELLGALALAYAAARYTAPASEQAGYVIRAKTAARQALALDPGEVRANKTMIGFMPFYGHWTELDRISSRMVAENPNHPLAIGTRAEILMEMGRWREVEPLLERKHRIVPFEAFVGSDLIVARWCLGKLHEADTALADALRIWPRERVIWDTRINYLVETGRSAEALRIIDEAGSRPPSYPAEQLAPTRAFAAAKHSGSAVDITTARKLNLDLVHAQPGWSLGVMQRLASMRQTDAAADLLRGAYMGEGPWKSAMASSGLGEPPARPLFEPSMVAMWTHPQFAAVTRKIGLESFWLQAGTPPDYRRA